MHPTKTNVFSRRYRHCSRVTAKLLLSLMSVFWCIHISSEGYDYIQSKLRMEARQNEPSSALIVVSHVSSAPNAVASQVATSPWKADLRQDHQLEELNPSSASTAEHGDEASSLLSGTTLNNITVSPCLVVFHIPKTGGTSLRHVLRRMASQKGWSFETWPKTFLTRTNTTPYEQYRERMNSGKLATTSTYSQAALMNATPDLTQGFIHVGHILPNFLTLTETINCKRITVLREPIDRVISLFYYLNHSDSEWSDCLYKSRRKNRCGQNQLQYHNDMVRMLSGAKSQNNWNAWTSRGHVTDFVISSRELDQAKQFVRGMDLVCFLDVKYEDCLMQQLPKLLGLPVVSSPHGGLKRLALPHANVGPKRNESRNLNAFRQKIADSNGMDLELYRWTLKHFQSSHFHVQNY